MIGILYIIIGIFVIAVSVIFFYKNKQKQPYLNTKQEPVIQLDTTDNCSLGIRHCEPQAVDEARQSIDALDYLAKSTHNDETIQAEQIITPELEEELAVIDKEAEEEGDMDIIMLQIKALANRPYAGYELLQALTSSGLNFGKMNIFHGDNFSVAAATTEGSFPVDNIGSFKCLGLMVFMKLNPKKKLMMTFELMLDTARQLAEELGGEIFNDLNQPINAATIKKLREKIYFIEAQ